MPKNHEIEPRGHLPQEDDKFFPTLIFVKELEKRIEGNQPLDVDSYEQNLIKASDLELFLKSLNSFS